MPAATTFAAPTTPTSAGCNGVGSARQALSAILTAGIPNRSRDWFRQAERDLEQAGDSRSAGRHEWSCFAAHQAAEKAVKALHLSCGQEAWGDAIGRLIGELPAEVTPSEELAKMGHALDGYYIPARYPNGHPEGAPFEHYTDLQSQQAIDYAGQIVEFVRIQMAR
ncbi:MAG: HEPN domain-containing protein, partial [Bryobacteraceae bacterium]|nr:HEPN domain-containing protein [Bryobacteraceae bacterium]